MKITSLICLFIIGCASHDVLDKKIDSAEITSQELLQHIRYLASDELGGRKTGEEGNRLAAAYIAGEFRRYGLQPIDDQRSFFQPFPFLASVHPGPNNRLSISLQDQRFSFVVDTDFRPLSFTKDTSLTGQLVFVGYGISAESLAYDDYAGLDVRNKIAVALRYSPEGSARDSIYSKYTSLMVKAFTARDKGASGLILVTGPLDGEEPSLIPFRQRQMGNAAIAVVSMKWSSFDTVLHAAGKDLRSIQRQLNEGTKPQSFVVGSAVADMQTDVVKEYGTSANIIGYLEGVDPVLRNEILVIGAHMDHLGLGGEGSGSMKPDTIAIHYGADDNASGSAGLLEVAQYLASRRHELRRSILFASFSGEEIGLLGSDYYVKHPLLPLERTVGMINMDMIGRLRDSVLVVEGMGTSSGWEDLVKKENADSLSLRLKPDGYGPSDQSSFYGKDIPVLFFFTNLHDNYHRPSDTWDKINYLGEQKVARMVSRIAVDIANDEKRPAFTRTAPMPSMGSGGDRQGVRVSLGVVPDYAEDVAGMKISGTRPGSAAEKAGLKGGDILVSFGGKAIKNIYDFTYLLGNYKPGDEVIIVVKRGAEEVSLTAKLEGRK